MFCVLTTAEYRAKIIPVECIQDPGGLNCFPFYGGGSVVDDSSLIVSHTVYGCSVYLLIVL